MYDFLDEGVTYEGLNQYLKRKADWLEEVENKYSDTTKRTYWILLNTRVNFLELSKEKELYDWNKQEIIQTIKTTATTSSTTKSMLFTTISNYIAWAYKKGYNYVGNPCDSIDTTGLFDVSDEAKKQQYKTLQEFNEFIYGLDCTDVDRAMLTLLRYGVPIDNVGTMRWKDVDRENKILNVYSEDKGLLKLPIDNSFIRFIDSAKNCFTKPRKQSKSSLARTNKKETDMEDIQYLDIGFIVKTTEKVDWQHMNPEDVYNKLGNLSKTNGINRISVPNLNMSRRFDLLFDRYKQNGVVTNIDIDEVNEIFDNTFTVNKNSRVRRDFLLVSGIEIKTKKRPNKKSLKVDNKEIESEIEKEVSTDLENVEN
jgi:hypothetical protein